ncbi:hypothetical protein [Rhodococcus erythropolis]|uniref:hypothetical protein n=1 Tax=Rhodococcus erythropolis TaxID=1833 RepID=UPI001BEB6C9F|nr:hypothetical protein [Rhodococcus erythropolis]MBT2269019.1 hypothetical protein [Rhodococcus erythropolis]
MIDTLVDRLVIRKGEHSKMTVVQQQRQEYEEGAAHLGGLMMGYRYSDFYVSADSIHQNVGFSGYPIGGVTMALALFGTVEELCKAQALSSREC